MISTMFSLDFGIYKNTLKRFKWGSFLYFVILFFSLPFVILVNNYHSADGILTSGYNAFPILLALSVPTVTALLIFNFVHSEKQGIFVHSLPVERAKIYISSILAGLTLMIIPVLANAFIMIIMKLLGYDDVIANKDILMWLTVHIFILFFMFSVASFSAFLTGNSFAHFGINVIIQTLPLIIALGTTLICDAFFYGYTEFENSFATQIAEHTPIVNVFSIFKYKGFDKNDFFNLTYLIYTAVAILFYVFGYLLYKNRKIENCGEVSAFWVFGPILKYAVTTLAAIASFAILCYQNISAFVVFLAVAVICAIVYFACEMLLNKTLKVFNRYKGYLCFATCGGVLIAMFAFGNFFGSETYVPDYNEISECSVFENYWHYRDNLPLVSGEEAAKTVTGIHKEILKDAPAIKNNDYMDNRNDVFVCYKLKNGKRINRQYSVTSNSAYNYIKKMFDVKEYKIKISNFSNIDIDNLNNVNIRACASNYFYELAMNEDSKELMKCIKKDIENIDYDKYITNDYIIFYVQLYGTYEKQVFEKGIYREEIYINHYYENTINFLKEKGYYDVFMNNICDNVYLYKTPVTRTESVYKLGDVENKYLDFEMIYDDIKKIADEDAEKLIDKMTNNSSEDLKLGDNYCIFIGKPSNIGSYSISFTPDKLPDYLKKYIE